MAESDLERLKDALDGKAIAKSQEEEGGGNFVSAWYENVEIVGAQRTSKATSRITYRFPVLHRYLNPTGTLHGGAIATIFDVATSWLLYLICEPGFWTSMGTTRTLNCTYLRPAMEDEMLRLECEIVHCGKRMCLLTGTLMRETDRAVIATCEHNKFNVDADSKV